jgi:hypothetical protein
VVATPAAAATPVAAPVAAEEPCMRGEMEIGEGGTIQIKGRWALLLSDFDDSPKNTSPFDYTFEGTSNGSGVPMSGFYSGGFNIKIGGRMKKIKEGNIDFKFTSKNDGSGSYNLKASGSNEFGTFTMRGSAVPSTISTSVNAYSVEIFRTYTSYHPAPVVTTTGRGWSIEPPTTTTPASALSRLTSAPASKEPRSGLTSNSNKFPVPSPLVSAGISDSGRKRKAPTKLVDELNLGLFDSGAFDQATRSKLEGLLKHMKGNQSSVYFLEPVDPVRLGIPSYFDVIKQPMDLKTVERKLISNNYGSIHEFADDVRLIFSNSKRFNEIDKTMPVYVATLKLETVFENKWRDFEVWRNNKLQAEREKEAAAAAAASSSSASKAKPAASSSSSKTPSAKKANGGGGGGGGGTMRRSKSEVDVNADAFIDMQAKMLEMSQEILNLQRATTTQQIQLQIATATGRKKGGRALTVSDVLPDDPVSESLKDAIPLTIEEKQILTKQVEKLKDPKKSQRVLDIVQEQMQLSGIDHDGDIEIDIDTLPIPTLRALQRYLKECFPKRTPPAASKGPKSTKRKLPAPLPVPSSYAPPATTAAQQKKVEHVAKKPKAEPSYPSYAATPHTGNDTSDSEDDTPVAAPWESSATTIDAAESRRNAGLDTDSDDDDDDDGNEGTPSAQSSNHSAVPAAAAAAASFPSSSSSSSSSSSHQEAETAKASANMDAWGSGWGAPSEPEPAEMRRERSDSYDTTNNWSQLQTDIQEKQQVCYWSTPSLCCLLYLPSSRSSFLFIPWILSF